MNQTLQKTTSAILLLFVATFLQAQCFPTQNFTTAGSHSYTIPSTASSYTIRITSVGADGGDFLSGGSSTRTGGSGASIVAEFSVNAGDILDIYVGGSGANGTFNRAGGGGGGSAVVLNDNTVLIASSGGGGGTIISGDGQGGLANTNSTPAGGAGAANGGAGGGGFNFDGGGGFNGATGGGQGTLTSIGSGGSGSLGGGNGGIGFGGGGGGGGQVGGGGGGYRGGDGGTTANDGGKGGDSFVSSSNSGTVITNTAGTDGGGIGNSGSVMIECISPLPVELISFHGKYEDERIILKWETASEENNYGFEIQKSIDGINWNSIDFIDGQSTSFELNRYEYLDIYPIDGMNYYRLKQLDFDGRYEYSKIISFDLSEKVKIQVLPNPVKNEINIKGLEKGQVVIVDYLGKVVLHTEFVGSGINISSLPSGIYFVQIKSGNKVSIEKIIKE